MKMIALLVAVAVSGCLVPVAKETPAHSERIPVEDGFTWEESIQWQTEKDSVALSYTPWEHGPLRIPHASFDQSGLTFWIDEEGIHCRMEHELEELEPSFTEQEPMVTDGKVVDAFTYCLVYPESIVEHAYIVSNRSGKLNDVVVPGLPDMNVQWEASIVTEFLYANETHEEQFFGPRAWIEHETMQEILQGVMPSKTGSSMIIHDQTFCLQGSDVRIEALAPGAGATGIVDFSPSTPIASEKGTINGNTVAFEMDLFFEEFQVTLDVIPVGAPNANPFEISCVTDRTWLEQPWTGSISYEGTEGIVEEGTGYISALHYLP